MKNKTRYTFEACRDEALKYEYLKDFREKSSNYYSASHRLGYINEISKHLKSIGNRYKRCIYACVFSDKHIYIGLTFNLKGRISDRKQDKSDSVTKYAKNSGKKYSVVQLTPYIDKDIAAKLEGVFVKKYTEMGWGVLNKSKTGGLGGGSCIWSEDAIYKAALKCKNRLDFLKKYGGAVQRAKSIGIYDDVCNKCFGESSHKNKWTLDDVKIEALKYSTRSDFAKHNRSAQVWAIRNNVFDEVCSHMAKRARKWTPDKIKKEALKYTTKQEFSLGCSSAYTLSKKMGIFNEVCAHMVDGHIKWTPKMVKKEALKYNTRSAFRKGSVGAYGAAVRYEILDNICSHMQKTLKMWSLASVKEVALKFDSKNNFKTAFGGAYNWAQRNGVLEEVCTHMKKVKNNNKK